MADELNGAGEKEAAKEARLVDLARQAASTALSRTTVAAAVAVIAAVSKDEGRGALAEPAADLRRLRTDAVLMPALASDIRTARDQAQMLLSDALWVGYETGAATRSRGLPVSVELTDSDRKALADYPILGLTAAEAADGFARQLLEGVNRALSQPLVGAIDAKAIPRALQVVASAHAERVASAVGEAFRAGVQAAARDIGHALVGA